MSWELLTSSGLVAVHAVKCAIMPDDAGHQNPPRGVVDVCAPQHLASELAAIEPTVVVTLCRMAYRALVVALGTSAYIRPSELKLTTPPEAAVTSDHGFEMCIGSRTTTLFSGPFVVQRDEASRVLRRAARKAGLCPDSSP
jgi:uracil-DNA glycosylase